jgi:hypothetical protein
MRKISWQKLVSRLAIVVALICLLFALGDLLGVALSPLRNTSELTQPIRKRRWHDSYSSAQDTEYWQDLFEGGSPIITRTVAISVTPNYTRISFNLWLTRTHPCVDAIANRRAENAVPQFIEAAFGDLTVEGVPLSVEEYQGPFWKINPTTQYVNVQIKAARATDKYTWGKVNRHDTVLPAIINDNMTMNLDHMRLTSIDPIPDSATSELVSTNTTTPTTLNYIFYAASPISTDDDSMSGVESSLSFLQRVGDTLDIPLVSSLLVSLTRVLPLVIFIYMMSDQKKNTKGYVVKLKNLVVGLLILHFSLHFINGCSQLVYNWQWLEDLSYTTERWLSNYYSPGVHPLLGRGPRFVAPGILGVLVPALIWRRSEVKHQQRRTIAGSAFLFISLVASLVGIIIAWANWQINYDGSGTIVDYGMIWPYVVFSVSVLYLLILGVLESLLYVLSERTPYSFVTPLTTLVILVTVAWDTIDRSNSIQVEDIGWLAITMILGTAIIMSIIKLAYSLAKTTSIKKLFKPENSLKRMAKIFALLLTVPMESLVNPRRSLVYTNTIMSLGFAVDRFALLIWFGGLLWILYSRGRTGLRIDDFNRKLGLLGVCSVLFSPISHWLYIPITFLLGWLIFTRLLVHPADYWDTLKPLVQRVVKQRPQLIDRILEMRAAESAHKEYQKRKRDQLAKGEISFAKYQESLDDRYEQLKQLRSDSRIVGHPARDIALIFGPRETAWDNAVHGLKFSLLFALPWIALALRNLLLGPIPQNPYPLWYLAHNSVTVLLKWGLYGFFFGYFYPYMRGKSGLQKGFWMFIAAVLPALPLSVFYNASVGDWQAMLFWILQVFIHCMLLGLVAFDYVTLRQDGYYDWRLLFEVHGLPSVGVSISSILVATGAAITTLLTTQATNLVGLALRFVIPQVPSDLWTP